MLILTIRTDKQEAELGLYDSEKLIAYRAWEAHRKLAETIHDEIKKILQGKDFSEIEGLVVYKGPGSFTGLRIGVSVANALAVSLESPIIGSEGDNWIEYAIKQLLKGQNEKIILPKYGAPVHITQQKK